MKKTWVGMPSMHGCASLSRWVDHFDQIASVSGAVRAGLSMERAMCLTGVS
jgi:hypothetical protein